jgi:threonine/homoserine/homoserine lactone efflux protein
MINTALLLETFSLCALGTISPGVNFFLVTANAIENGKKAAIIHSLGIILGVSFWILICIFGLGKFISNYQELQTALQILIFFFLMYLSYTILKNSGKKADDKKVSKTHKFGYFSSGLITASLNVSVGIFYSIIFAKIIPEYKDASGLVYLHGLIFISFETLWFLSVAFFVAQSRVFIEKYSKPINILLALTMMYFAFGFLKQAFL